MSRIFLDTSAVVLGEPRAGYLKGTRLAENLAELAQFLASPQRHAVWLSPVDDGPPTSAWLLRSWRTFGTPDTEVRNAV